MMQLPFVGTRAWWAFWGRRNIVESVNAGLKGGFTDISRGHVQTFSSTRILFFLAHTPSTATTAGPSRRGADCSPIVSTCRRSSNENNASLAKTVAPSMLT